DEGWTYLWQEDVFLLSADGRKLVAITYHKNDKNAEWKDGTSFESWKRIEIASDCPVNIAVHYKAPAVEVKLPPFSKSNWMAAPHSGLNWSREDQVKQFWFDYEVRDMTPEQYVALLGTQDLKYETLRNGKFELDQFVYKLSAKNDKCFGVSFSGNE